jgi:hypothetical protein
MCVHTHFLALLYDIVEPQNRNQALKNVLNPPEDMVRIGSPFAILYMYEALEKEGQPNAILDSIEESYQPMLDLDATSVWESFASGTTGPGDFPTRSHTHAWSSAPIHFLNRIVLGIQPTGIGGTAYTISPRVDRVTHAEGASAGHTGPVTVSWKRDSNRLDIQADGPATAKLKYAPNETHEGYTVTFNGEPV